MITHSSTARLSSAEVEHYHREGYVLPQGKVFSDQKFNELVTHFDAKLEALPSGERPEAMDTPHFSDSRLFEWAFAPEILDLVEPLLGPDILLFSTHFICKPQGNGRRVPWHEDSAYWRKKLNPMEVATVWLALDPSTQENGCMYVIPKTHNTGKMGFSDYEGVDTSKSVFDTEIIPSQRKDELAVPCELAANHCSLHDARTQHGSPPNHSNKRRCGWTLRFMPATTRMNPDFKEVHPIFLARGNNVLNQELGDPTRDYSHIVEARRRQGIKGH